MPNKKKSVTMQDVSAHAGVSLKTVSNVVNDWPYVSEETRQKVWQAIEAVGYRPNQMARSLVTGKTKAIGVMIPDIANPFFGLALRGCEDTLYESEYSVFLCNTNEELAREAFYLDLLMSRAIDGLILWGTRLSCAELYEIVDEDVSLVTVDMGEPPRRANHTNIDVDSVRGARTATAHLLDQGYERVAHIRGPEQRVTSARRLAGYEQALREAGRGAVPEVVVGERPSLRGGYRAAQKVLADPSVDAIFCYNDLMAIGAMLAARQAGRAIPGELGLAGFDNIAMASIIEPQLTTMDIAQYELGQLTGTTVLAQLDAAPQEQMIAFPVELIERGSSNPQAMTRERESEAIDSIIAALSHAYSPRGQHER